LWSLELQHNRTNLEISSHKDILGFLIGSQKYMDIFQRNLIMDAIKECSYYSVNFSFIDLNESLLHTKEIYEFLIFFFLSFICDP
jgi:hypothetical protein